MLPWVFFSLPCSQSEGGLARLFRESYKHIAYGSFINALNTSIEFSQRHDVIEHRSRSSFGSVSGRLNRTVTPSATLVGKASKARADLARR